MTKPESRDLFEALAISRLLARPTSIPADLQPPCQQPAAPPLQDNPQPSPIRKD